MLQIDPSKSVLIMSHGGNTFKKKMHLFNYLFKHGQSTTTLRKFINNDEIYEMFTVAFKEEFLSCYKPSPFDICYFCAYASVQWLPTQKDLGGSEQAIVHLSEEWVKSGKSVVVYFNAPLFHKGLVHNGVVDRPSWEFVRHERQKNLILWRVFGFKTVISLPYRLNADRIFVDLHDNNPESYQLLESCKDKYDKVFFKSEFHHFMAGYVNKEPFSMERSVIVPNGIRIEEFDKPSSHYGVERNSYRMCYCSCYTRGL